MNKWQITIGLVIALVAVLSLSVAVFAQGPTPPTGAPQGYGQSYGQGYGRGMGRGMMQYNGQTPAGAGYGFRFGMNGGTLLDATAEVTGLTVSDVAAELQSGQTFAQVAQAHGKTATDVVNAFLADRKAALDQAVADGRLTQDVADTMLATMKTNVEQQVNRTWQPRGMGYRISGQYPAQMGSCWNQ
jgi:hypothetical protein